MQDADGMLNKGDSIQHSDLGLYYFLTLKCHNIKNVYGKVVNNKKQLLS